MRAWPLLTAALLAASARAEDLTTSVSVGGGKVGTNRYSEAPDGSFKSVTEIKVGPTKISSSLTGAWKEGGLAHFRLSATTNGATTLVNYEDGKLTVEEGGTKAVDAQAVDLPRKTVFSSFHPQLSRTLFSLPAPGSSSKALLLENAAAVDLAVTASLARPLVLQGSAASARSVRFQLAGLDVGVVTDGKRTFGIDVPAQQARFSLDGVAGVFDDPLAKYPELSQPRYPVKRLQNASMTMRDGKRLLADVALPDRPGKYPTILVRTCYGKELSMLQADFYASRGYAYVAQDVRGRGASEGDFDPLVQERADGYDTLEWIEAQAWSDGRVGMIGASYLGFTQWSVATTGHPALKCIVPQVSPPDPVRNFPWDHGMFMLAASLWWSRITGEREGSVAEALDDLTGMKKLETLPLSKADDAFRGSNLPFFDAWLQRDSIDKWRGSFRLADVARVKIPVLHVSGTWDGDGIGTKLHWETLRRAGHRRQWLVFGPWTHLFNTTSRMGEVDYGPAAILELDSLYLRFFDEWLKGREGYMADQPKARVFLTGANRWIESSDWPPPSAQTRTWYLGGRSALGLKGGGTLTRSASNHAPARLVYDPAQAKIADDRLRVDPNSSTAVPESSLAQGSLVFRTEPFERPTRICGPVDAHLHVATSARDAGFHVAVAEQDKKGTVRLVGLPGRARIGWKEPGTWGPVTPGKPYALTIRPWEFAHEFPAGSRLVVIISCDAFPGFARIPGTGEPDFSATKLVRATQTLYRSKARPSRIVAHAVPL